MVFRSITAILSKIAYLHLMINGTSVIAKRETRKRLIPQKGREN